jgi:single-stranded DNA-binding protein
MNVSIVEGHLGNDPRIIENEKIRLAYLSVATNSFFYDKENKKVEVVDWVQAKIMGDKVELIKHMGKGDRVFIKGKNKYESWEKDGQRVSQQVLLGLDIHLTKKSDKSAPAYTSEDVPF